MQLIPLQNISNQSLSVVLDDIRWDISIKTANNTIAVSLTRDGLLIIENLRAVANMRIIPCKYQEAGNFTIITTNFEIPDYTKFGISQYLVYASAAELQELRIAPSPYWVASDFDPIAALPLRFKPQGYVLA
jgi:hypothetical protein